MELEEALAFIGDHHRAVLSTRRHDGTPQMSPVTAAPDGAGNIVMSTRAGAMKTRNLRRDPRASLVVLSDTFFGRWVQVDGEVEIVDLPEAMDGLLDYYRRASGEHPDWDEYRAAMVRDERVLLRLRPHRAGPDRSG